ncbi:MAG: hypothetical protein J6034_06880 [Bacteroidaceae bacterium]|nr:hypothetical protein [Bacteroidaceae bacterium]
MQEGEGWVKLFRKFTEWGWYGDTTVKVLFLHLLLTANYEDKEWRGKVIKRGQVVVGRKALAETLRLSEQNIRTALDKLESTHEISRQATNKFTIITICKYDTYQTDEESNQPTTNQQLTNNQPTTNHNIRNKEYKNITEEDNTLTSVTLPETGNTAIDLKGVIKYWNNQIVNHASTISPIKSISGKRKVSLLARVREYGKESIKAVIDNAIQSDFLNGKNKNGWKCTFDWIFQHPNNFIKVYENNYGNTENTNNGTDGHKWGSQASRVWDILTKPIE